MLSCSFLSKALDTGSNVLFLDIDTLLGLFLSKDSDSDSNALLLGVDSLSHSLFVLVQ